MIDFKGSFAIYCAACYALAMASTALAVVMGTLAGSSVHLATMLLPLVLMPQMLFIGYFVVPDLIPVWLRWLQYLCPMTYATRIILVEEFYRCSDDPFQNLGCELLLLVVEADPDDVWWYWLMLASQFVLFRLLALVILRHSANKFY
jgi:ABC-type multidrug transport system permease subunit